MVKQSSHQVPNFKYVRVTDFDNKTKNQILDWIKFKLEDNLDLLWVKIFNNGSVELCVKDKFTSSMDTLTHNLKDIDERQYKMVCLTYGVY